MAARRRRQSTWWKDTPPAGKVLIIGSILGGVGFGIYAIKKNADKREALKRLKDHDKLICSGVNLTSKAYNIYDALWQYMYGTQEDETTAVNELLSVPKSCVPELARVYMDNHGKNLYEDFTQYVEGDDYEKVRHLLEDDHQRYLRDMRRYDVFNHIYNGNPQAYEALTYGVIR